MKKSQLLAIYAILLSASTMAHASAPLWTFKPLTSIDVQVANNIGATVQYQITNLSTMPHTLVLNPVQGISQIIVTSKTNPNGAGQCKKPIKLKPNQTCTLTLAINGSKISRSISGGPQLCQANSDGSPNPNMCYQPAAKNTLNIIKKSLFGYIGDQSNKLWKCPISPTGNITGTCTALTNSTFPGFNQTASTTFKQFNGQWYAYVADFSDTLWKCALNASGDLQGGCTALKADASLAAPTAFNTTLNVSFATYSGTTYAYVSDNTSNVFWKCPMSAEGDFSGSCTDTPLKAPLVGNVTDSKFYTFDEKYLFLANNTSFAKCTINDVNGNITGCTNLTLSKAPLFSTYSLDFANIGFLTFGYMGTHAGDLGLCSLNGDGSIDVCTTLDYSGFSDTQGVTTSTFSNQQYLFVANNDNKLYKCALANDGTFINGCKAMMNTSGSFNSTYDITFFAP